MEDRSSMKIRSEPFLWIHLMGIVMFPVASIVTSIGLGIGYSLPYFVELPLIGSLAILPILLMQLFRPFDIFSVLIFSLKPQILTEEQRKILSMFKTGKHRLASIVAACLMCLTLWLLYLLSPLATSAIDLPQWRVLGLAISIVGFLLVNLFFQVPLSVLLVLTTKESNIIETQPCLPEEIEKNFTVPGIKVNKILWFLENTSKAKETI